MKYLLIFIVLITSCASFKGNKKYKSPNKFETLTLHKDSTYQYELQVGFYYALSTGVWKKANRKKIYLTSEIQEKNLAITNIREVLDSEDSDDRFDVFMRLNTPECNVVLLKMKLISNIGSHEIADELSAEITFTMDEIPEWVYVAVDRHEEAMNYFLVEEPLVSDTIFLKENINSLSFEIDLPDILLGYKTLKDKEVILKGNSFSSDIMLEILPHSDPEEN